MVEKNALKKGIAALVFGVSLLTACTFGGQPQRPKDCLENTPQSIPGLKIDGARSEANVIHNMWPVFCKAQEVYQERRRENSTLKGNIELKLYVEFNGEIGPYSIVRNTLRDPAVENQILSILQFMDFDPYGPQNSDSDILFPMYFKP
jgi:hypothetical protein